MTTEQATLPGAPEAPAANIPPRHRPWHYLVITEFVDYDDDGEETGTEYVPEGYDDEDQARQEVGAGFDEVGVWDNWAGVWIVEPDWSDEVEMTAEGPAPYSLRPEASAA